MLVVGQNYSGGVDFPKCSLLVSGECIVPILSKRSALSRQIDSTIAFGVYKDGQRAREVMKEICRAFASGDNMFILPME